MAPPPKPEDRIAIIAAERGPTGAQLVAIDAAGDRQFVLLTPAIGIARDTNPSVSPDHKWVVFASSRERPLDSTSLWIARLGVERTPVRLTSGPSIESHPTWTPDGSAVVFASTRDGGDFDLWRQAIVDGKARGEPVQLTSGPQQEVTPTVARDGTVIYAAVSALADSTMESHLEQRAPDGTITVLTDGFADASPALSPDETQIAFGRIGFFGDATNTEVWVMRRADKTAKPVFELGLTEESGPVWSHDGRVLLATSVLLGRDGKALFSSVVIFDLAEASPHARMLKDHAGGIPRLTPAIVAPTLDAAMLRGNPEYLPELARIMDEAIQRAKKGATR